MKRTLKYVALALGAVIVALAAVFIVSVAPLQSAPAAQIVNGVHFVSDGRSTIAIVPLADHQALLVDSGMDHAAAKVLEELSKLGMSADSVKAILLTHGHFDHTGGAPQFPKAELLGLAPDVDLVAGLQGSRGPVTKFISPKPTGLKLTRTLQDGESFNIGATPIKVFAIPGHTSGSAAYLIDEVLFLGDSANATTSGKLQSATWMFTDDMSQNEASLRSLDQRLERDAAPVQVIAFGHSGLLQKGLAPLDDWAKNHS